MRKIVCFLLLFLLGHYGIAENYRIIQKSDSNKNYVFSVIKNGDGDVVAKFCLVNPDPFYLFSVDNDPDLFSDIEKNIFVLAERKNRGQPVAAVYLDFSNQAKAKWSFNIRYIVNYFGVLLFAAPYIKKVSILSPNKTSRRFFIETKVGDRDYYGAMVIDTPLDVSGVKKLLKQIKGIGAVGMITPAMEDFSVKLVSFSGKTPITIYESEKNHKTYSCVYLAGTNK